MAISWLDDLALKNWSTLVLIIAGLLFVAYFQIVPHLRPTVPAAVSAADAPSPRRHKSAAPSKSLPVKMEFGGSPCPGRDCSEDKAGYQWAAWNHINDPDDCTGSTVAFIEGCRVYAGQRAAATGVD